MIKFYLYCFVFGSLLSSSYECKDFHEGTFKLDDHKGSVSIITRHGDKQTEQSEKHGFLIEYKITWTDDCNYILSNRKVIKGTYNIPPQFVDKNLHCKINKIEGNTHTVICKIEGGPEIETPPIEKIDHI